MSATETGYYVPNAAAATHLLDGHEPVARVQIAHQIMHDIERQDRQAIARGRTAVLYPQIDRQTMRTHRLYLAHTIPAGPDDFSGDLLVTGDRLTALD